MSRPEPDTPERVTCDECGHTQPAVPTNPPLLTQHCDRCGKRVRDVIFEADPDPDGDHALVRALYAMARGDRVLR